MRYYQTKWHDMYHSFDLRRAMVMTRTLPLQRNQGRRSSGSKVRVETNERTRSILLHSSLTRSVDIPYYRSFAPRLSMDLSRARSTLSATLSPSALSSRAYIRRSIRAPTAPPPLPLLLLSCVAQTMYHRLLGLSKGRRYCCII